MPAAPCRGRWTKGHEALATPHNSAALTQDKLGRSNSPYRADCATKEKLFSFSVHRPVLELLVYW